MLSKLSRWILKLWGWRITGRYPHEEPKVVIACAPHTSNWDFPIGVLLNSGMEIHGNYVGKHSLFRWPWGFIFRWLGGIPVDRSHPEGFVNQVVSAFNSRSRAHLAMAPEGTRKKVGKLKTGFYRIAKGSGAVIVLCKFDWGNKELHFDPNLFRPGPDEAADLEFIWNYFKGVQGKNPELGIG